MRRRTNKLFMRCISLLIGTSIIMSVGVVTFADDTSFDLQTAIDEAQNGDTIVLSNDVDGSVTIPEGKELTIDLGDHYITTSEEFGIVNYGNLTVIGSGMVISTKEAVNNYGTVKLLGGEYTIDASSGYPLYNRKDADMTIQNVTVTSGLSGGTHAIWNEGNLTVNEGTIIITREETTAVANTNSNIVNSNAGSLTINGGTFYAKNSNISCYSKASDTYSVGNVVIYGGDFNVERENSTTRTQNIDLHYLNKKPQSGSITIYGGTFTSNHSCIATYVEGYYIPIYVKGGRFNYNENYSIKVAFANKSRSITVDGAVFNFNYPGLVAACSGISLRSVTSEKQIGSECVDNGATVNGAIIKVEPPTGKTMWYIGTEAINQVKKAQTGTKVSVIYGNLSADISHDIFITLASGTSATINKQSIPAGSNKLIVHKDLSLVSHPCLSSDSPTAYYCSDCGKYYKDAEGKTEYDGIGESDFVLDHTISTVSSKPATTTEEGYEAYYQCAVCGEMFSDAEGKCHIDSPVVIPIIPDWGEPTYQWSNDNSTVTATRICKNGVSLNEIETVGTTSEIIREATVTQVGIRKYTSAVFSIPAFEVQTKEVEIPRSTPTPTPSATPTSASKPSATPTATATPIAKPTKAASVTLTLDKKTASVVCGKTVSLKATLKGSKDKITWKSSDSKVATVDANGKVTSKMAGEVTITATAAGKSATCVVTVLYKDVTNTKDFWYAPTNYLTGKGVVKGYANQTEFRPANVCTRAQMVTFIWRLQGEPKPKAATCKFKDVKKSDYFYKACIWGNENHIVEGYKDGTFGPQIVCARKHAVTFLWRLAKKPSPKSKENKFKDVKTSDYFYTATLWASEKGILAGYSDGTFKPDGDCLRRQMVTFLYKYDKFVNGKG